MKLAGFHDDIKRDLRDNLIFVILSIIGLVLGVLASIPAAIRFIFGDDVSIPGWLGPVILFFIFAIIILYLIHFSFKYFGHKDRNRKVMTSIRYTDIEYAIYQLGESLGKSNDFLIEEIPGNSNFDKEKNIIIGIDRGGAIVGGLLGKMLKLPVTTIGMRYAKNSPLDDRAYITAVDAEKNFKNLDFSKVERIILIDDAVRTGTNLTEAVKNLNNYIENQTHDTLRRNQILIKTACILKVNTNAVPGIEQPHVFIFNTDISRLSMPWDTPSEN